MLVNNAGNFNAGFFEELSPEEFRAQIETTLFGPVNVTRAALPVMRAQRSGLVVTISSTAGIVGRDSDRLRRVEVRRRGLDGVAGPGGRAVRDQHDAGRARLLPHRAAHRRSRRSYAESSIDDYAERTEQTVAAWKSMNGQQGGDPAKLADALVHLAAQDEPPLRFAAGADAVATFENRAKLLLDQADAHRELSSNLAHDDA